MQHVLKGKLSSIIIQSKQQAQEAIYGPVYTEEECLQIIDMCRMNVLPRVKTRLGESERNMIRPGSVFVYEEEESGILRWTDGKLWSSSKIHGRCLIYYEQMEVDADESLDGMCSDSSSLENILQEARRAISDTSKNSDKIGRRTHNRTGLIKMAATLRYKERTFHLMAYTTHAFTKQHIRGTEWDMVKAWSLNSNLELRMSYRKRRGSLRLPEEQSTELPEKLLAQSATSKRKRESRRSNSFPCFKKPSNPFFSLTPDPDSTGNSADCSSVSVIPDDFLQEYYMKNSDFYIV